MGHPVVSDMVYQSVVTYRRDLMKHADNCLHRCRPFWGPTKSLTKAICFGSYWTDASEIRRSPVDMENLSLCTGFYTCPDFFHQPEVKKGTEN